MKPDAYRFLSFARDIANATPPDPDKYLVAVLLYELGMLPYMLESCRVPKPHQHRHLLELREQVRRTADCDPRDPGLHTLVREFYAICRDCVPDEPRLTFPKEGIYFDLRPTWAI